MATYNPNPSANAAITAALLKPTTSFAQLRADKDRALSMQAAITQQTQQQEAQAQQAALATQQELTSLYQQDFLSPDKDRWKSLMDSVRTQIGERVRKDFGGDYAKYAKTMYMQDLAGMRTQIMNSPLYTQAQNNKLNYGRLIADQSKGLIDRPVQYKLADGSTKTATARDNYVDFVNGRTDHLMYNGGYEVKSGWQKAITESYSPQAKDTFEKVMANDNEIISALVSSGMASDDAKDYMVRYGKTLGPVFYKFDVINPVEVQKLQQGWARIALAKERNAALQQSYSGPDMWATTFNERNIVTRDRSGVPASVPVTVYKDGKPEKSPSVISGFDASAIADAVLSGLGFRENKTSGNYQGGNVNEAFVMAPNEAGGVDLRRTDLSRSNYNIVGTGNIFIRDVPADQQSPYQKATGGKEYLQQVRVRISSDEAAKAKYGRLFDLPVRLGSRGTVGPNAFGYTDTVTGKGTYKYSGKADGQKFYDVDMLLPVNPSLVTRLKSNTTETGRLNNSKMGKMIRDQAIEVPPNDYAADIFDN
nr:hypothetical protein [uncultured Arsenicibacter sp.]